MPDYRIVDVSTILSKWHDLLKEKQPNFPCQTFTMFMRNNSQELVRCRECMHCLWDELHKDKKGRCMEHHIWCEADGFCHMGEKMDGGAE